MHHDTSLSGQVYGYDPDGDAITAQLVSGPSNGTVTLNPDGTFIYTPNERYVDLDSFSLAWSDGTAISNIGTVSVEVYDDSPWDTPQNHPPIAYGASFRILHDTVLNGRVRGLIPTGMPLPTSWNRQEGAFF